MQISVSSMNIQTGIRGFGGHDLMSPPEISWRAGSTSTSLQTILSISASKSRSSLWRWIMNPPRWHTIAWSTLNWTPHAQIIGVSVISQSYRNLIASLNSFLFRLQCSSLKGITVSQFEDPFSEANSTARLAFNNNNNNNFFYFSLIIKITLFIDSKKKK